MESLKKTILKFFKNFLINLTLNTCKLICSNKLLKNNKFAKIYIFKLDTTNNIFFSIHNFVKKIKFFKIITIVPI